MQIKILLLGLTIFFTTNLKAQLYETLENNAAELLISLSEQNPNYLKDIEKLKSILFTAQNADELKKMYSITLTEFDSLKNHFLEFEKELKDISIDSALVLFNYWYLHFSNLFYNYADEKCFLSEATKIILFSTSMSCACTLEMARNQALDLLKFRREIADKLNDKNENLYFWIIDSYEHNELQIRYETLFAPSVIVLDRNNELLWKIEYEEDMLEKLTTFINNNFKSNGKKN